MKNLASYRPVDEADRRQAERIAAFVRAHVDCFERGLEEGHITGSAWLMDPDGTAVLLTFHRKLDRWLQLGGHADGESDVLAVAQREAEEESGLARVIPVSTEIFDLDVHPIPLHGAEKAHFHYDIRFAFRSESRDVRVSAESKELAWVPLAEVASRSAEPSLLRMREKWRAGFPYQKKR